MAAVVGVGEARRLLLAARAALVSRWKLSLELGWVAASEGQVLASMALPSTLVQMLIAVTRSLVGRRRGGLLGEDSSGGLLGPPTYPSPRATSRRKEAARVGRCGRRTKRKEKSGVE